MTARILRTIGMLALAHTVAGCGGSGSPTAPSVQTAISPQPVPTGGFGAATLSGVTLYGVVSELTASGATPVEGVWVYCDACGKVGHTSAYTDANGSYSFTGDLDQDGGIWARPGVATPILVRKEGYEDPPGLPRFPGQPSGSGWREVMISGDTRFDTVLVRR